MSKLVPALCAITLLWPSTGWGWRHTRQVWLPEDLPVQYTISDYVEDSVPEGFPVEAIQAGYANWEDAECADIPTEFIGTTSDNTPYLYNYENHHSFDDPGNDLAPGVLAANLTLPPVGSTQPAFVLEGESYYRALDSDIVYNKDVDFATDEDIDEGDCAGEYSLTAVATHEIGHQLGLAHSCDRTEMCTDPERLAATMYWMLASCSTEWSTIEIDDIRGLDALYSPIPLPEIGCSFAGEEVSVGTLVGLVPLEVGCSTLPDYANQEVEADWDFGDGEGSTELDPTHTYDTPGNYTVSVCYEPGANGCGDLESCHTRIHYIRACAAPVAVLSAEKEEEEDGLTWQLLNDTDLSVEGCITAVSWEVFDDEGDLLEELTQWEPEITFPEAGTYRVVLTVSGPVGSDSDDIILGVGDLGVEPGGRCGCDTPGTGSAAWPVVVLVLVACSARRRWWPVLVLGVGCQSAPAPAPSPENGGGDQLKYANCSVIGEIWIHTDTDNPVLDLWWERHYDDNGWLTSLRYVDRDWYDAEVFVYSPDGLLLEQGRVGDLGAYYAWFTYDWEGRQTSSQTDRDLDGDIDGSSTTTWFDDGVLWDSGDWVSWTAFTFDARGRLVLAEEDNGRDGSVEEATGWDYQDADNTVVESYDAAVDGVFEAQTTRTYDDDLLVYYLYTRPNRGWNVSEAWYTYNEDGLEESRTGTEWDYGEHLYDYLRVYEYDDAGRMVKGVYDYINCSESWPFARQREERLVWDCPESQP